MITPSASQYAKARAHHRRRFTRDEVHAIRVSMEPGVSVAGRLGVNEKTISSIRRGLNYGPLLPDEELAQRRRQGEPEPFRLTAHTMLSVGAHTLRGALVCEDRQEQLDAAHECRHGALGHDRRFPEGCRCWERVATLAVAEPVPAALVEIARGVAA